MPREPLLRIYLLLGLIAVLGSGFLAYTVVSERRAAARNAPPGFDLAALDALSLMAMGRADAGVTIVEFADFQCQGCARFAREQLPRIKAELIDAGLVRYVFVEYPLPQHTHAVLAARAARCADEQEAYWHYHDQLYHSLADWAAQGDPIPAFVGYASDIGIEPVRFEGCLRSDRFTEEVNAARTFARSVRVRGTPSIFVNGESVPDAFKFDDLRRRVEAAAQPFGDPERSDQRVR